MLIICLLLYVSKPKAIFLLYFTVLDVFIAAFCGTLGSEQHGQLEYLLS